MKKWMAMLLVVGLSGCGLIKELWIIFSKPQPIHGPVFLDGETVLNPPKPLKVIAKRHSLSIRTDEIVGYDGDNPDRDVLVFKNGKKGKVTGEVRDQNGSVFPLKLVAVGGADGGIYLSSPLAEGPDFPFESRFDRVTISTEVPFRAKRMEWNAEIQK